MAKNSVVVGVVFGLIALAGLIGAIVYIRRRKSRPWRRRQGGVFASLGMALLPAGDSVNPLENNDADAAVLKDEDDAILLFDAAFDDHRKYGLDLEEEERVVFDKYVGDQVKFEGGPEADGQRTAMADLSGDHRPTSSELARAKCIILESSRLQVEQELEIERRKQSALQGQIESEREERRKIAGVNGALARQNLKLKTEFEKLKREYQSREDELQNIEVSLDEHMLMKVPAAAGTPQLPAAMPVTDFMMVSPEQPTDDDLYNV